MHDPLSNIEFTVNGHPVRLDSRGGIYTMSAPTVTAASPHTRNVFLRALDWLRSTAATAWQGIRKGSSKVWNSRAVSAVRRYIGWAVDKVLVFGKAAGALPLALLTVTSRSGQKALRWTYRKAVSLLDHTLRFIGGGLGWVIDKMGGQRFTLWVQKQYNAAKARGRAGEQWMAKKVGPHFSPEKWYMKTIKVGSFAWIGFGLITTFVTGLWVIPAALAWAGLGLMLSPSLKARLSKSYHSAKARVEMANEARRQVKAQAEQIISEYGPEIDKMPADAKGEYEVRIAMLRALDGKENPYEGLTAKQRQKAEKFIREYEATVAEVLAQGEAIKKVEETTAA